MSCTRAYKRVQANCVNPDVGDRAPARPCRVVLEHAPLVDSQIRLKHIRNWSVELLIRPPSRAYQTAATFHGASGSHAELSTAFYVENGPNVSCLSSAASPVPQLSGRTTPARGASKRPAIIGGVLGGLVRILTGLATACVRYYRRRARLAFESRTVTVYTSTIFPRTAELNSKERREYLTNRLAAVQTHWLAALHTETATAAGTTPAPFTDSPSVTPAETDGALRTQDGALQARIRTLEAQLQSHCQWALGHSDEPPPGYLFRVATTIIIWKWLLDVEHPPALGRTRTSHGEEVPYHIPDRAQKPEQPGIATYACHRQALPHWRDLLQAGDGEGCAAARTGGHACTTASVLVRASRASCVATSVALRRTRAAGNGERRGEQRAAALQVRGFEAQEMP
ncbi:hypothetical protein GGX14DRAFT_632244 [Mycena pura]|uniref:Uncharacterized protein n=1 Tax=Mycena pura TaxID=153505 RepID=A0AAD6VJV3_9AGAR|nr:hypothetical protein GGX14DRAFT_632244 [Mycena pura]